MSLNPDFIINGLFLITVLCLVTGIRHHRYSARPKAHGHVPTDAFVHADLIGVGVLITLFGLLLWLNQSSPPPADGAAKLTPGLLMISMITQAFPALLVFTLLSLRNIPIGHLFGLKMNHAYRLLYIAPAGVLITYLFMLLLTQSGYEQWLVHCFGEDIAVQDAVRYYQQSQAPIIRILLAVSVVIVAPIAEEVIFRGYIYAVTKRFTARIFATLVSALLFSVVHNFIPGLIPLAFLAIILTISYEITGSLWAPISIHALFNASTLLLQEIHYHQS